MFSNCVNACVCNDVLQVKTPEVSGSTVLYPSHMAPQGPGSRRKRKQSASEVGQHVCVCAGKGEERE